LCSHVLERPQCNGVFIEDVSRSVLRINLFDLLEKYGIDGSMQEIMPSTVFSHVGKLEQKKSFGHPGTTSLSFFVSWSVQLWFSLLH